MTRRPTAVILGALLLCAGAALALTRLELRGGIYELFPHRAGPIAEMARFARAFGGSRELVVLVSGDDPTAVDRTTRWLRRALEQSPLIAHVGQRLDAASAARALSPHLLALLDDARWPEARRRLAGPGLDGRLAELRRMLLSPLPPDRALITADPLGLLEGTRLLGAGDEAGAAGSAHSEGRAALVRAEPKGRPGDLAFCERLDAELSRILDRAARPDRDRVRIGLTGAYRYPVFFARQLRRDLLVSSVVAAVGCALVFTLLFGSLRLLPLTLSIGGAAVLLTLALAALGVGGLNALSLSFAAICIGLGIDAAIHVLARMRTLAPEDRSGADLPVVGALTDVAPALLAASATTVVAFAAFALSDFAGLAHTGLLAAAGLGLALVLTLVLFPALLVRFGPRRLPATGALDRLLGALARRIARRRVAVLIAAALVAGLAGLGARDLRIAPALEDAVPWNLPPAVVDRAIARAFGQAERRLIALVRADDAERALRLNEAVARALAPLRHEGAIVSCASAAPLLPSRQTQRRRLARLATLGTPAQRVARVRAAMARHGFAPAAFAPFLDALRAPRPLSAGTLPEELRALVGHQLARYEGQLVLATSIRTAKDKPGAVARVSRAIAALDVGGEGATVTLTGAPIVGPAMGEMIRRDLLLIGGVTLGAVLLVLGALLRRPWPVLATSVSLALTGLLYCGLLPLCGLRIDLYTLITIPIVIGYGVDDHIYVVRHHLSAGIEAALAGSGRAVIATTLTSGVAFSALGLCQTDGLRHLGLAAALGLGCGLVGSLVVLPALLSLRPRG